MAPVKEKRNNHETNLLPQNIEAEEAVLGAILVNPRLLQRLLKPCGLKVFINRRTDIFTKQ